MIGLGSNRLSVCRRGGMSVTQAGRGGMEWLAGGRDPILASPYSAQATAALLAQFPTQWQTIRDYGFAHPALVPFINEDPMMVMSLIEGLGTRYAVTSGSGSGNFPYINIGMNLTSDLEFTIKAKKVVTGVHSDPPIGSPCLYCQPGLTASTYGYDIAGTWYASPAISTNYFILSLKNQVVKQNDANGVEKFSKPATQTINRNIYLFSSNGPSAPYGGVGNVAYAEFKNNSKHVILVPFYSQERKGMLDIHDLENPVFRGNDNSAGSFEEPISETPAS